MALQDALERRVKRRLETVPRGARLAAPPPKKVKCTAAGRAPLSRFWGAMPNKDGARLSFPILGLVQQELAEGGDALGAFQIAWVNEVHFK